MDEDGAGSRYRDPQRYRRRTWRTAAAEPCALLLCTERAEEEPLPASPLAERWQQRRAKRGGATNEPWQRLYHAPERIPFLLAECRGEEIDEIRVNGVRLFQMNPMRGLVKPDDFGTRALTLAHGSQR